MSVEKKLASLGLRLPEPPAPVAAYIPSVRSGDLLFTSGQLPLAGGKLEYKGRLGAEVSLEDGYSAARLCALNCLGVARSALGDLERVIRVVKVVGFVASAPGFTDQPKVVNGCSELLVELLGEAGKHARSAVGVAELPLGAPVEIEMILEVR